MKVTKATKTFTPITIVLESQAELDYLTALSNISSAGAMVAAQSLGYTLSDEAKRVQMPFFNEMTNIREELS